MILKTTVRLSHPAPMDLVLRKRISLNIFKRQSITERLKKSKWLGRGDYAITQTGVTYEVVSNVPKASEELEDRESLAQLAASGNDCAANDGETYIGECQAIECRFQSSATVNCLRREIHPGGFCGREHFDAGPAAAERRNQGIGADARPAAVDEENRQRAQLLSGKRFDLDSHHNLAAQAVEDGGAFALRSRNPLTV